MVRLLFILAFLANCTAYAGGSDEYHRQRSKLVDTIKTEVQLTAHYLGRDTLNPTVLKALGTVPRHEFVPKLYRSRAYQNQPLPIGYGQTISQPYIVAIMTDLLDPKSSDRVLEIGTGSGYQAAILSELVAQVYTIEIIPLLGSEADQRLRRLGYQNIHTRIGDGYYGWPDQGPFDGIVVTAAASHIPPPLIEQLKPGGRMIIPVGSPFLTQQLVLITKQLDNRITTEQLLPVRFVPLTGEGE